MTVLEAQARQEVPLELIVQELEMDPGFERGSLVNIEFQWQAEAKRFAMAGLEVQPLRRDNRMADIGLSLTASDLVVSLAEQPEGRSEA
jgi:hypothetical protein